MHDGVFRQKRLSRGERQLLERLQNHEHHSDAERADAIVILIAAECRLPKVMLVDQCPNDFWAKEWMRERLQNELLGLFANEVWQILESMSWDSHGYPAALRDAVATALDEWLEGKRRCLECKILPGKERHAAAAMKYYRDTQGLIHRERKEALVAELIEMGRVRMPFSRKPLDINGPIAGVNLSAL